MKLKYSNNHKEKINNKNLIEKYSTFYYNK